MLCGNEDGKSTIVNIAVSENTVNSPRGRRGLGYGKRLTAMKQQVLTQRGHTTSNYHTLH